MSNEIIEFAENIGATDLKSLFQYSEFRGLLKRRNYFLLDNHKYLIVKISRSQIRTFWGIGKKIIDLFNALTKTHGDYFLVALVSNKSGWVLSKRDLLGLIAEGSLSYSAQQGQYKLNDYNLKDRYGFTSIEGFFKK